MKDLGTLMLTNTLERIAAMLERPPRECTPPKRVRNEEARCGNCPYGHPYRDGIVCRRNSNATLAFDDALKPTTWCGDHPDFWKEA